MNLWTQDIMEKDLKLKRKKNYLILKATCENGLIDNASRKFINFWIANFISQNLKWELLLTKKKYFTQSRCEINKDEVLQGKFVAWPFFTFPQRHNWILFQLLLFICIFYRCIIDLTRKEIFSIWLNLTTVAFRWRAPMGKWLMVNWPIRNQSTAFIFVMLYKSSYDESGSRFQAVN